MTQHGLSVCLPRGVAHFDNGIDRESFRKVTPEKVTHEILTLLSVTETPPVLWNMPPPLRKISSDIFVFPHPKCISPQPERFGRLSAFGLGA